MFILFLIPRTRILAILFALFYLAYSRARVRQAIRSKLSYLQYSFLDDFLKHCICCFSYLSVCQEARESKAYGMRKLDFCSGEPLIELEEAHERAVGRLTDTASDILIPQNGTVFTHLKAISKLTKTVIILSLIAFVIFSIVLMVNRSAAQILILLLVFLQPFLLLYFFYWRVRRQYATLDLVLKMFFVGFWVSTFQAMVLESLIQLAMKFFFSFVLGIDLSKFLPSEDEDGGGQDDYSAKDDSTYTHNNSESNSHSQSHSHSTMNTPISKFIQLALHHMFPYLNITDLEKNLQSSTHDDGTQYIKDHVLISIIVLLVISFVMAAGIFFIIIIKSFLKKSN